MVPEGQERRAPAPCWVDHYKPRDPPWSVPHRRAVQGPRRLRGPAVIQRVGTKRKLIDLVCASECGRRRGSIWARVTRNEGAQASRAPTDAGHD